MKCYQRAAPWLPAWMSKIDKELKNSLGAKISSIPDKYLKRCLQIAIYVSATRTAKFALKQGDQIIGINDRIIYCEEELLLILGPQKASKGNVKINIIRKGRPMAIDAGDMNARTFKHNVKIVYRFTVPN